MRVLWFTNIPLAPLVEHWGRKATGTGWWMQALADSLCRTPGISRLGVVYSGAGCPNEWVELEGIDYIVVSQSKLSLISGIGCRRSEDRCLHAFVDIVEQFQPDVIHIHGTERFYGRLKVDGLTEVPVLVSIQGLMRECARYAWGEKSFWDVLPLVNVWEITRNFPTLRARSRFLRGGKLEECIIKAADGIAGRTDWDRSYCWSVAPKTPYFHVDEMIRPEFFSVQWSIHNAKRHRVYTTSRLTFLKGMHVFLEAMAIVKRSYPDLEVVIAGQNGPSPENVYCNRLVHGLGLSDSVKFLGWIPGERIIEEIASAHCFVNTSFIENSSNALQEAMLIGCPCVATFTGGMPSLMDHRRTGLMVPPGCAHLFADAVREYFESDTLCKSLGTAAREVAHARHAPQTILRQLLDAYRALAMRGSTPV